MSHIGGGTFCTVHAQRRLTRSLKPGTCVSVENSSSYSQSCKVGLERSRVGAQNPNSFSLIFQPELITKIPALDLDHRSIFYDVVALPSTTGLLGGVLMSWLHLSKSIPFDHKSDMTLEFVA